MWWMRTQSYCVISKSVGLCPVPLLRFWNASRLGATSQHRWGRISCASPLKRPPRFLFYLTKNQHKSIRTRNRRSESGYRSQRNTREIGLNGWHTLPSLPSLPEVFRSIPVPKSATFWRRLLAFVGPGYLVAVGYMDPGNWATDIGGGAAFAYRLLSVVLISSLMAVFLQALSAKLGIATGRDLAQACRDTYKKPIVIFLWLSAEIGIVACDIAEVIGAAIALNLLFHIPLAAGVILTGLDVLLLLALQHKGFRWIEGIVITLIATIMAVFCIELFYAHPSFHAVIAGFVPHRDIVQNAGMLYIALGILGATVMPHNLYLHSSVV